MTRTLTCISGPPSAGVAPEPWQIAGALYVLVHLDGRRGAGIVHLRALLPVVIGELAAARVVPAGPCNRLRSATDHLWILEASAAIVVADIRGRYQTEIPISADWAAGRLRQLTRMGRDRTGYLRDAGAVCPLLRRSLKPRTGADLVGTVKRLKAVEADATRERAHLRVLLTETDGLALAG